VALRIRTVRDLDEQAAAETEEAFGLELPLVRADESSLEDVLAGLIETRAELPALGQRSREYVEHVHAHTAVAFNMQPHGFLMRNGTGPLEVGRNRATAQPAFGRGRAPARLEARPVGGFQCFLQQPRKIAAVVGLAHRVPIGHLLRSHQVAPAQLGGVEL